jgi:hypothetical protein
MNYLYIYDKDKIQIGKFKILKETEKQYKIDYRSGKNIIHPDETIWLYKEWFHKGAIDNDNYTYDQDLYLSTNLKDLYNLIKEHVLEQKMFLDEILREMGNEL